MYTIARWLNAWKQTSYGFPICVINNSSSVLQEYNIRRFHPDYYIAGKNQGQDIAAFYEFINDKYEWDVLYWFADDMLPMCKDFLDHFIDKIELSNVGIVGHHRTPVNVRTCAFAITREAASLLGYEEIRSREACLHFESTMVKRVEHKYVVMAAHCPEPWNPGYLPVSYEQYADVLWDCHYTPELNLWDRYDKTFGKGYRLPLHD